MLVAGAGDLSERLVVEAVLGELRRLLVASTPLPSALTLLVSSVTAGS